MSGYTNRTNQRVELIKVDDEPHEDYYESGVPLLLNTAIGQVVAKSVHAYTVHCPKCDTPAQFNEKNEPVCPECGIICSGDDAVPEKRMVRDLKAAGQAESGEAHA